MALAFAAVLTMLTPAAKAGEGGPGFSVRAILPDNQLGQHSYFWLVAAPGARQQLEVQVSNTAEKPLEMEVSITGADTGTNGIIQYPKNDALKQDPSLGDFVTLDIQGMDIGAEHAILSINENIVRIAPGSKAIIRFALHMPPQALQGQVLGSLTFAKVEPETEEAGATFAVQSVYQYTIAVVLQSQQEMEMVPELSMGAVQQTTVAGYPAIVVPIANHSPVLLTGGQMQLRIYDKQSGQDVFTVENQRISMAPSSLMPYTITFVGKEQLPQGSYGLELKITYQEEAFVSSTDFTITANAAQE